jgi:hypothetical protein
MSKRVIFTCTVLLLLGVAGALETFASFSLHMWYFNPVALYLPVSIALFMGLPGSRAAATVVFSIIYGILAFLLMGSSIVHVQILRSDLPVSFNPVPFIILFVVMYGCVLSLLHWMLYSPPFDEHLGES